MPPSDDGTLRDKIIVDALGAISAGVGAMAKSGETTAIALSGIAQAIVKLTEAMAFDRRLTAVETLVTQHQAGMDRHRSEHRAIAGTLILLLISAVVYFIKRAVFP